MTDKELATQLSALPPKHYRQASERTIEFKLLISYAVFPTRVTHHCRRLASWPLAVLQGKNPNTRLERQIKHVGLLKRSRSIPLRCLGSVQWFYVSHSFCQPLACHRHPRCLTFHRCIKAEEEMNLILLRLIEYLGHSNPFISNLAFEEVCRAVVTLCRNKWSILDY